MSKREKWPLGDLFGLKNCGVNLTRLDPAGESALFHRHSKQDEFIYILEGDPTLVTDAGEIILAVYPLGARNFFVWSGTNLRLGSY